LSDNQAAAEPTTPAGATPELKVDIETTFPDADIFGVKLVNGRATRALIDVTNHEDGPISVVLVAGVLRTASPLPEDAPPAAGILSNLTATPYKLSIAAGEKHTVPYSFILDMNPQDTFVDLLAVISNEDGQVFQIQAHSGPASIVEPPTSIFDPQM